MYRRRPWQSLKESNRYKHLFCAIPIGLFFTILAVIGCAFGMEFKDKVAIVTGVASGIGKTIASEFKKQGAIVCTIDLEENDYFVGDISEKFVLEQFVEKVISDYGNVDFLINNAMKSEGGIDSCDYEGFIKALKVGVAAPYYLTKLLLPYFSFKYCQK